MEKNNQMKYLYVSLVEQGERYARINRSLIHAVAAKYGLHSFSCLLLLDIAIDYEANEQTPCKYSCSDLAEIYGYSKHIVFISIRQLLKFDLITQTYKGKGQSKSEYIPNVELINKVLIEYVTKNKK
jgi:hypothetical protein